MKISNQLSSNPRVPLIIECALSILRDKGDVGLTMRQVAVKTGISLSNLQFYFKNKNELLKGMVEFYFEKCALLNDEYIDASKELNPEQKVHKIILFGLMHSGEDIEQWKIFREFWAVATRNEKVNAHVEYYYSEHVRKLSDYLLPLAARKEDVDKAVTLLLPFVEGYSITSPVLPLEREQVAELLTRTVLDILQIQVCDVN